MNDVIIFNLYNFLRTLNLNLWIEKLKRKQIEIRILFLLTKTKKRWFRIESSI